jgi:hypothetical protein
MKFTKKYEYEIEIDEEKLFKFVEQLKKEEYNYFWPENKDIRLWNGTVINEFPWQVQSWVTEAFYDGCFETGLDFIKIDGHHMDGFEEIDVNFPDGIHEDIQKAITKLIVEKETKK